MISKFDEIMERPIDDGYEENVRVTHNDMKEFLKELEINKQADIQEALKHMSDLFK